MVGEWEGVSVPIQGEEVGEDVGEEVGEEGEGVASVQKQGVEVGKLVSVH